LHTFHIYCFVAHAQELKYHHQLLSPQFVLFLMKSAITLVACSRVSIQLLPQCLVVTGPTGTRGSLQVSRVDDIQVTYNTCALSQPQLTQRMYE
jgi:hypothetical protein